MACAACGSGEGKDGGDAAGTTATGATITGDTIPTTGGVTTTSEPPPDPSTSDPGTSDSTTSDPSTSGAGSSPGCVVAAVPADAGLDPFYEQGCQVEGMWVVANGVVDPEAVRLAAGQAAAVFEARPDVAAAIGETEIRLGVIGAEQRLTEMPEYRDLYEVFPGTDWDNRARGLGATVERPLVSAGEENLLCLATDVYAGEDILLHEFAHVIHQQGLAVVDPTFDADLVAAFEVAVPSPAWDATYAETDINEYWAEGVQSYFERNLTSDPPDGVHGPIGTRDELADADPLLFDLVDQHLGAVVLPPHC